MTSSIPLNFELVYSHIIICYKVVVLNSVIKKNSCEKKDCQSVFLCCLVTCSFAVKLYVSNCDVIHVGLSDVAVLDNLH